MYGFKRWRFEYTGEKKKHKTGRRAVWKCENNRWTAYGKVSLLMCVCCGKIDTLLINSVNVIRHRIKIWGDDGKEGWREVKIVYFLLYCFRCQRFSTALLHHEPWLWLWLWLRLWLCAKWDFDFSNIFHIFYAFLSFNLIEKKKYFFFFFFNNESTRNQVWTMSPFMRDVQKYGEREERDKQSNYRENLQSSKNTCFEWMKYEIS